MPKQRVTIFHLDIPLVRRFVTAGGTVSSRNVALVRFGDGPFGWGEAAPYPGQDEPLESVMRAAREGVGTPTLLAALDEAASDHEVRLHDARLSRGLGERINKVPVSIAVGLTDPLDTVERAVGEGVQRFKLKIEPGRMDHVREIRRLHGDIVLGVDANGSFDGDTVAELALLGGLDIAYLEQPVGDLASVTASNIPAIVSIPIFADESIRSAADATAMLELDHVAGVVVKPGRLGWSGALAVREIADSVGKLWRASGLLETGVGRAYTNILAGLCDAFVSDVAPADWFLETDVAVPCDHGIGVEPDMDVVDRYLVESFEISGLGDRVHG